MTRRTLPDQADHHLHEQAIHNVLRVAFLLRERSDPRGDTTHHRAGCEFNSVISPMLTCFKNTDSPSGISQRPGVSFSHPLRECMLRRIITQDPGVWYALPVSTARGPMPSSSESVTTLPAVLVSRQNRTSHDNPYQKLA